MKRKVTLTTTQDTYLKAKPLQSGSGGFSLVRLPKGTELPVQWVKESTAGHVLVSLVTPVEGYHNWYLFKEHVEVTEDGDNTIPVPYFSQLDIFTGDVAEEHRLCNTACCWMVGRYLYPQRMHGSPRWYLSILDRYGDTTDHTAQTLALAHLYIPSRFVYDLTRKELEREIDEGRPVICGILHRGTVYRPSGGHMIVVIGYNLDGVICHDPYGDLNRGYNPVGKYGKQVLYKWSDFIPRWEVDGPGTGWARVFS